MKVLSCNYLTAIKNIHNLGLDVVDFHFLHNFMDTLSVSVAIIM